MSGNYPELKAGMRVRTESGTELILIRAHATCDGVHVKTGAVVTFATAGDFVHDYSTDAGKTWRRYEEVPPAIEVPKELFVNVYATGVWGAHPTTDDAKDAIDKNTPSITQRYITAPNWKKCVKGELLNRDTVLIYEDATKALCLDAGYTCDDSDQWHCPLSDLLATLPKP
jgi:hypothetical protein